GRGGERPRQYRECTRANGPPVRTGGLRSPRRRPPPGSPRTPGTAATTASATGTPSDPHAGGDRTGRRIGAAPTAELAPIVRRHGSRGSRNEERGHGGRERTSSGTRRVDPPWRSGAVHRAALGGDAVQGGRRIPRGGGAGGVDRRGGSGRLRRAPSAPRSGGTGGGARAGALGRRGSRAAPGPRGSRHPYGADPSRAHRAPAARGGGGAGRWGRGRGGVRCSGVRRRGLVGRCGAGGAPGRFLDPSRLCDNAPHHVPDELRVDTLLPGERR